MADTSNINNSTLTVVVLDSKSQPISGAKVSITPSDATAVTNSVGEVQFKLGSAKKYEVTATGDGKTVTVPYYVTENGATRLVVNPSYVATVERNQHPSIFSVSSVEIGLGVILLLVIGYIVIRRFFFKR